MTISLGTIQRGLITISDLTSAIYAFIYVLALIKAFKKAHFYNGHDNDEVTLYSDTADFTYACFFGLTVWLCGEFINVCATILQRTYATFQMYNDNGEKMEKLFIFKIIGFFHYFFVLVGSCLFVVMWGNYYDAPYATLAEDNKHTTIYKLTLILYTVLHVFFVYAIVVPYLIYAFFKQRIPTYYLGYVYGNIFEVLCSLIAGYLKLLIHTVIDGVKLPFEQYETLTITNPVMKYIIGPLLLVLATVVSFGFSFFSFGAIVSSWIIGYLTAFPGYLLLIGTLGAPYWILSYMAPKLTKLIESFRAFGRGDAQLFDGLLTSIFIFIILLLGLIPLCSYIFVLLEPLNASSVAGSHGLDVSPVVTKLWMISKVIGVVVQICLPLLKLYAQGKLKRLKLLLSEFPEVLMTLFILAKLEVLLEFLESLTRDEEQNRQLEDLRTRFEEKKNSYTQLAMAMHAEMVEICEAIFDFDFGKSKSREINDGPTLPLV